MSEHDPDKRRKLEGRYLDRLMPDERKRISGEGAGKGDYKSLKRYRRPTFKEGDWLKVSPSHWVQVAGVPMRKGHFRVIFGSVRDDRMPGPRLKTKQRREDGVTETEPEGVDVRWLDRFAKDAQLGRRHLIREAIEGR